MRIMIIQVNADLTGFSDIYVFSKENILKAKYSWFSDMFQIYDKGDNLVEKFGYIFKFKKSNNFCDQWRDG